MVDANWGLKVGQSSTKDDDNRFVCTVERMASNKYMVCFHANSQEADPSDTDPTE